jgi:hypothetical protein
MAASSMFLLESGWVRLFLSCARLPKPVTGKKSSVFKRSRMETTQRVMMTGTGDITGDITGRSRAKIYLSLSGF